MSAPLFLHPRYWPTWFGFGLLWIIVRLPHGMRMAIGSGMGRFAYAVAGSRKHIVQTNLRLCFPQKSNDEVTALARDTFRSGGMSIVETAIAWLGRAESVYDIAEIVGLENLKAAVEGGKGAILLGTHMATLDLAGAVLSREVTFDVMYRANKNALLEWIMTTGRARLYPHPIERGDVRQVIANLKLGHVVWYGPDQDYGARNAVFTPFFDVPAATMTAVSRIAKITGAPVVPFTHFRTDKNSRYQIVLRPALEDFPSDSFEADAKRINEWIEFSVKARPEQYWWFHRRFKTRPEGEPEFY